MKEKDEQREVQGGKKVPSCILNRFRPFALSKPLNRISIKKNITTTNAKKDRLYMISP